MPEIKDDGTYISVCKNSYGEETYKEYPEGQRSAEMILVRMLTERRSWADYMEISQALWNIRLHADSMRKEHDNCAVPKA